MARAGNEDVCSVLWRLDPLRVCLGNSSVTTSLDKVAVCRAYGYSRVASDFY